MKRVMQSLKTGVTEIMETPCPQIKPGHVLIQTHCSLISPGTEKMLIDFGKASIVEKVRQQPEKVGMVVEKIKTDGLLPTLAAVQDKLEQLLPLGYCNVGTIIAVGVGVEGLSIGDRVVSNGAHAEIVCVPKNLCCKIPQNVADNAAVFTVLGAIALQGIRLANPTLGETFVVIGLGLIGLLTVQLLHAHGCRVLAVDLDSKKVALAAQFGAETVDISQGEDLISLARLFSKERGVDGVLITASTKSNEPVHQAAQMCRKKGRIVLVGVTGLELSRADFYEKELSFQVSCSYGPGRYDIDYEEQGHDYPIGFVRWTEQRNFEAVLDMFASDRLTIEPLISQRFPFLEAARAYATLNGELFTLGVLLEYSQANQNLLTSTIQINESSAKHNGQLCVGFIGAGNYASRILIPAFKKSGVLLKLLACTNGISGAQVGKKFGFKNVTTDVSTVFSDPEIDIVVIATRHNSHARFVCEALKAKKHVFVEKPLCLTLKELDAIVQQLSVDPSRQIMVGFNRRFSPHIQKIKRLLSAIHQPKSFVMTINAGEIPSTHWTQDPLIGGGRIIGEGCHFVDLLRFLAGSPITNYNITKMGNTSLQDDKATITLSFADGSFGTIHYLANGHKSVSKERLEAFAGGKILQLDNFRKLRAYGWSTFRKMNLWRQDKGQIACVQQFVSALAQGGDAPIPVAELVEVGRVTIELATAPVQALVEKQNLVELS